MRVSPTYGSDSGRGEWAVCSVRCPGDGTVETRDVLCMLGLSALFLLGCSKAKRVEGESPSTDTVESCSGPVRQPAAPPPPGETNCVVAWGDWSNWDRAVKEADVVLIARAMAVTKYATSGDGKWVYYWHFNRFRVVEVRRGTLDLRRLSFVTADVLPVNHCEKPAPWARKGQVWALGLSTSSDVPTVLGMERRSVLPPHERLVLARLPTATYKQVLESVRRTVEERYGSLSITPLLREETPSYFAVELLGDVGRLEANWMAVDKATFNVRFVSPPQPMPLSTEELVSLARQYALSSEECRAFLDKAASVTGGIDKARPLRDIEVYEATRTVNFVDNRAPGDGPMYVISVVLNEDGSLKGIDTRTHSSGPAASAPRALLPGSVEPDRGQAQVPADATGAGSRLQPRHQIEKGVWDLAPEFADKLCDGVRLVSATGDERPMWWDGRFVYELRLEFANVGTYQVLFIKPVRDSHELTRHVLVVEVTAGRGDEKGIEIPAIHSTKAVVARGQTASLKWHGRGGRSPAWANRYVWRLERVVRMEDE